MTNQPPRKPPALRPTHASQLEASTTSTGGQTKMGSLLEGRLPQQTGPTTSRTSASAPSAEAAETEETQDELKEQISGRKEATDLTLEEQRQLAELMGLSSQMGWNLRQQLEAAQEVERYRQRMAEIEQRVEPIQLTDLLFRDYITQGVPVWGAAPPVVFRSLSATVALCCDEAAIQAASPWTGIKDLAVTQTSLNNLARLAASCEGVGNKKPDHSPAQIHAVARTDRTAAVKAIVENIGFWLELNETLLSELIQHHSMFTVRLRKALNQTQGDQLVKKY